MRDQSGAGWTFLLTGSLAFSECFFRDFKLMAMVIAEQEIAATKTAPSAIAVIAANTSTRLF
jgi:hypothetical protein